MSAERLTLPCFDWIQVGAAHHKTALAAWGDQAARVYLTVMGRDWFCTCGGKGSAQDEGTARVSADMHAEARHGR